MATLNELQVHLGRLATILWNYGASFPVPTLDKYEDTGNVGFEFIAEPGGSDSPKPAIIKMSEIWEPAGPGDFRRRECEYEFIERPLNRRRAFHGHHPEHFAREFNVLVHDSAGPEPDSDQGYAWPRPAASDAGVTPDMEIDPWNQARNVPT